ncbi:uroporphyrinogen-III synthase [Pseudoprimorskyibacter insulae]|uniref:Tetrapyrrole biosynthesis uroporphyrinogen III synthase domain-containing protein n=1 Tax=Pseudoprimorskyibacter insulae TaxID=1695997 RepID=A0A2R8AYM4_9RHOB|nr:uroporphyrinogen-III synthase [Pseudoprimorskyibacter insulae]SPF81143.1 hypothetical protein PRI8871_02964 [Pseudoprimorskyibacter insulae]
MPRPVLLLTRPRAASERSLRHFQAAGVTNVQPIIAPLFETQPIGALPEACGTVIFTSVNGVQAFTDLGGAAEGLAFTVGTATDDAARQAGFQTICADGDGNALVQTIDKHAPEGPITHLHGAHTTGDITGQLRDLGYNANSTAIYDQVAQPLSDEAQSALRGKAPVIVPLFSPRSARLFAIANKPGAPLYIGCMSFAVEHQLMGTPFKMCLIARHPTLSEMTNVVSDLVHAALSDEC